MREGYRRTAHACSGQQLAEYLEGSIGVSHYPVNLREGKIEEEEEEEEEKEEEEEEEKSGYGSLSLCLKVF